MIDEATNALRTPLTGSRGGAMNRAWRSSLVVALALVTLALHLLVWNRAIAVRGGPEYYVRGIDFMATITGARTIRDGGGARLYDEDAQRAAQALVRSPYLTSGEGMLLPYIHPPFEALIVAPLLALPYPALYGISVGASVLAVVVALWLLARALPIAPQMRWLVLMLACSFSPLHQALWLGQTSPFMLLGWCGAFALYKRRRDLGSGALLALLALKPLLLPMPGLLLLLRWRLRAAAGLLTAIAAASIAAMPFLGVSWPWQQWQFLTRIASLPDRNAIYPDSMPTFRGLAVNLIGDTAPSLIVPLEVVLGGAATGLLLHAWWCTRRTAASEEASAAVFTPATDLQWALACIVAVLVPPHLGPHDHTLLIFPLWVVTAYLLAGRWQGGVVQLWLVLLWGTYLLGPLNLFVGLPTGATTVVSVLLLTLAAATLTWQLRSLAASTPTRVA